MLGAESTEGGRVFGDASEGDGAEGSVASGDVRANVRLGGNEAIGDTTAEALRESAVSTARPCRMFHRRAIRRRKGIKSRMRSWPMVN